MARNCVCALILALVVVFATTTAHAEQRELSLGLAPAYGLTYIDERTPSGGGGFMHLAYGITDALGIQLMGGATAHPLAALEDDEHMLLPGTLVTWQASAGIVYALDIVRIVPFFEAGLGAIGTWTKTSDGAIEQSLGASASLGLGADYLISRRWSAGVVIRYHAFLTDLGRIPIYLTAGPRITVRFGL